MNQNAKFLRFLEKKLRLQREFYLPFAHEPAHNLSSYANFRWSIPRACPVWIFSSRNPEIKILHFLIPLFYAPPVSKRPRSRSAHLPNCTIFRLKLDIMYKYATNYLFDKWSMFGIIKVGIPISKVPGI
jgi:hypothetical protein